MGARGHRPPLAVKERGGQDTSLYSWLGIPLCMRCKVYAPQVNAVAWAGSISSAAMQAAEARFRVSRPVSKATALAFARIVAVQCMCVLGGGGG